MVPFPFTVTTLLSCIILSLQAVAIELPKESATTAPRIAHGPWSPVKAPLIGAFSSRHERGVPPPTYRRVHPIPAQSAYFPQYRQAPNVIPQQTIYRTRSQQSPTYSQYYDSNASPAGVYYSQQQPFSTYQASPPATFTTVNNPFLVGGRSIEPSGNLHVVSPSAGPILAPAVFQPAGEPQEFRSQSVSARPRPASSISIASNDDYQSTSNIDSSAFEPEPTSPPLTPNNIRLVYHDSTDEDLLRQTLRDKSRDANEDPTFIVGAPFNIQQKHKVVYTPPRPVVYILLKRPVIMTDVEYEENKDSEASKPNVFITYENTDEVIMKHLDFGANKQGSTTGGSSSSSASAGSSSSGSSFGSSSGSNSGSGNFGSSNFGSNSNAGSSSFGSSGSNSGTGGSFGSSNTGGSNFGSSSSNSGSGNFGSSNGSGGSFGSSNGSGNFGSSSSNAGSGSFDSSNGSGSSSFGSSSSSSKGSGNGNRYNGINIQDIDISDIRDALGISLNDRTSRPSANKPKPKSH